MAVQKCLVIFLVTVFIRLKIVATYQKQQFFKRILSAGLSHCVAFSSSGAAMEINNVCLSIGNNDIISRINWQMMPRERWGLVGPNGAGMNSCCATIADACQFTFLY